MGMGLSRAQEAELEAKYGPATPKPVYPPGTKSPKDTGVLRSSVSSSTVAVPVRSGPCQSLWMPGWSPTLVNTMRSRHWTTPYKKTKADKDLIAFFFAQSGLSKAKGPRRVSLLFVLGKGRKMFDRDAPRKVIHDGLKECGALINDSPTYCYEGPVTYARALLDCQSGTLILLEDLGA